MAGNTAKWFEHLEKYGGIKVYRIMGLILF